MNEFFKSLPNDREALLAELERLNRQIYLQQMELNILNKAADEIIADWRGVNVECLKNMNAELRY